MVNTHAALAFILSNSLHTAQLQGAPFIWAPKRMMFLWICAICWYLMQASALQISEERKKPVQWEYVFFTISKRLTALLN